ncbi:energy-coupling factor transporter ATPase [Bianquea renquensis]|jgi:cobalt import ATP-binding protein cbiO 1|uniref:Energy-coupling factor transporter ATP-binding protein EcfA2 n=1 Tax=Bianquea renquensis TaxID=2763661 RepID=A0A926DU21_9FIRM|nr:energy-coupling factor transporter ATPase [Bianquea renquensis]MBC8543285.1 energy-coupling factor transporter ATPase [Bianquea renquensis]
MSIEVRDVSYVYEEGSPHSKAALDHVSLTIEKGEFIGIIGHTGSGKSTLIQHLNGLLKPSHGEILYDDVNILEHKENLRQLRQKVGLVFQYPEHQLFEMTIWKDVAFGPTNMRLPQDEINRRVENALSMVGISSDFYQKSPFELSGGQKRRVAIAGVLAMEPDYLILDEPTAGLDPMGRDAILGKVMELHRELGMTVVLVSHSMEDVARYVNRIIVMDEGTVKFDGEPRAVFSHRDELEAMGLGVPQVTKLGSLLQNRGFRMEDTVLTVDQMVGQIRANFQS